MSRLDGKVALVTGAANGIGKAIAEKFAREGALVGVADIDENAGRAVADALGPPAWFTKLNVTSEEDWQTAMTDTLTRHGKLDVLVNNAGVLETGTIEDTPVDAWRTMQEVNVTGTFLGCQAAIKVMQDTGGNIINMSSMAAVRPRSRAMAYAASKAAIVNVTKTVAAHCAEQNYGIRCNAVLPGAIDTDMIYKNQEAGEADEDFLQSVHARYPMGRMGTVEEIANGVVFLASDESTFMTGTQLRIDGGGTI